MSVAGQPAATSGAHSGSVGRIRVHEQRQAVAAHPMPGRLAVFDLDRTLLPGASIVALVQELAARGMISRRRLVQAGVEQTVFRHRGSTDAQIERVRSTALTLIAGLDRAPLLDVVATVGARLHTRVRPAARWLLDRHLAAGDFCILLSASPHELVDSIGRRLGVHRSIGTRAAVDGGRFTGGIEGPFCYGPGKLAALQRSLGDVDLDDAFAYADSASDLPILRACGRPVAVNPDRALRRVARAAGWPIIGLD